MSTVNSELMAREFTNCWKVTAMHQCMRFLLYLAAGIKNYIVTKDKKIGHLSQAFLSDLQVVFAAKAAVAQARRDNYELKRREAEREATRIRCDAFEAAADSFLTITSNETVNVTDAQESPAAVRNLQLPSVSQPGYCNHSPSFYFAPLMLTLAMQIRSRSRSRSSSQ